MNLKKSVLNTLRVFISITFYMISHNILLDEKQYEIYFGLQHFIQN